MSSPNSPNSTVGLIGYGTMGRGLARNLMAAGHAVTTFDVSDSARDLARADGAHVVSNPAEVARAAEVIVSLVPVAADVRAVVTGPGGLVEAAGARHLLVELSTVEPMVMTELQTAVAPSGMAIVDGGISASAELNWRGTGTLLIGGAPEDVSRAREVLDAGFGKVIVTGGLGSAKVSKLVNNLLGGVTMAALAEAFRLGSLSDVAPDVLRDGMLASWARCAVLERMPPAPELQVAGDRNDEFPDFHVDYMLKDLVSFSEAAAAVGASHLMADAARDIFDRASRAGLGSEPMWKVEGVLDDQ